MGLVLPHALSTLSRPRLAVCMGSGKAADVPQEVYSAWCEERQRILEDAVRLFALPALEMETRRALMAQAEVSHTHLPLTLSTTRAATEALSCIGKEPFEHHQQGGQLTSSPLNLVGVANRPRWCVRARWRSTT